HSGVRRGDRVAVLMGRSVRLAAAWLGVLKAGAAFVPLDPSYPRARLDVLCGDARPAALLTEPGLLDRVPAGGFPVVELDDDGRATAGLPATSPGIDVDPADAA